VLLLFSYGPKEDLAGGLIPSPCDPDPPAAEKGLYIKPRVMDIFTFCNSKVFFKKMKGQWKQRRPSMVHVNYHPDKFERMEAIFQFYWEGAGQGVLDKFPGGSEPGSRK